MAARKPVGKRNKKGIAVPTRAQKRVIKKRVAAKYPTPTAKSARTRTIGKQARSNNAITAKELRKFK
jgi:hypothetical protein